MTQEIRLSDCPTFPSHLCTAGVASRATDGGTSGGAVSDPAQPFFVGSGAYMPRAVKVVEPRSDSIAEGSAPWFCSRMSVGLLDHAKGVDISKPAQIERIQVGLLFVGGHEALNTIQLQSDERPDMLAGALADGVPIDAKI